MDACESCRQSAARGCRTEKKSWRNQPTAKLTVVIWVNNLTVSVLDPAIVISVMRRTPLFYEGRGDVASDRPSHVRAASGICRFGGRLIVIQDDANWLASIDEEGRVHPVALPRGAGGLRLFDESRGNKHQKLDLEACTVVTLGERQVLLAFGSGSTPAREQIVLVDGERLRVVAAHALYRSLREPTAFSGSELNVEGAVALGDDVILFNRGNGACSGVRRPVNATCKLNANALVHYLDDVSRVVPRIRDVEAFDLGTVLGTSLTFTDGAVFGNEVAYVAAAEASVDAVKDGPVAGVAIGILGNAPRYGIVCEKNGEPSRSKIEGLIHDRGRWLAVVDSDESMQPAEILELNISGL